jgi:hypothetical protein
MPRTPCPTRLPRRCCSALVGAVLPGRDLAEHSLAAKAMAHAMGAGYARLG